MQLPTPNTPTIWQAQLPEIKQDGHKYDRGHLLVAGGEVLTGAARLASRAAQRIGAGLVTLGAAETAYPIYASALESVMVKQITGLTDWQTELNDPKKNAVLIGCGLGVGSLQRAMTTETLRTKKPAVLDADALNNFAETPDAFFTLSHDTCVLTPHEGEFNRLFGRHIDPNLPKTERTLMAAKLAHCIIVLKGRETIIATPNGDLVSNRNAPPWLATAGSGDVLAGMIAGLLAQKTPVFSAACAAVWLHGDCASRCGNGLIAEDLVQKIPESLNCLPPRHSSV